MKSLNWPHLMSTTSQRYLVNKSYLEYSSLDTYYPKLYTDSTQAMKYWRGSSANAWVSTRKIKVVCEVIIESFEYPASEAALQTILVNARNLIELVDKIENCETFEELIALGERNISVSVSDYDLFDSAYIELNPEIGRFRWEANFSTDETYAYHADMRDLSIMLLSDE
jgi:hypothetical protein